MAKKLENASATAVSSKKTVCPITLEQFLKDAKPLTMTIDGQSVAAMPRDFSSGSFGYRWGDKITVMIGEVPVKLQANCNLIVVGSKDADK